MLFCQSGMNFQGTKLLDKFQCHRLPARQTLEGGKCHYYFKETNIECFYLCLCQTKISSYSANGCETMTTQEQSVQKAT